MKKLTQLFTLTRHLHLLLAALVAGFAVGLTGCQTRITAEKNPEQVFLIQEKVTVNGTEQVITKDVKMASGGWYATARSPLWATEGLKGLEIGVHTNGSVTLALGEYHRDLSTNAVVMVEKMFSGGAQLAIAIGDAYTKIAGGGAQADTIANLTANAYNFFKSKGGNIDAAKVTVDEAGKTFKIDDGSTCVECSADGTCTERSTCTDGSCAPTSN